MPEGWDAWDPEFLLGGEDTLQYFVGDPSYTIYFVFDALLPRTS